MNKDKYIDLIQSEVMREHYKQLSNITDYDLCRFVLFAHIPLYKKIELMIQLTRDTENKNIHTILSWLYDINNMLHSKEYVASVIMYLVEDDWDWDVDDNRYLTTVLGCDVYNFLHSDSVSDFFNSVYLEIHLHKLGNFDTMLDDIILYAFKYKGNFEVMYVPSPKKSKYFDHVYLCDDLINIDSIWNDQNCLSFPFKSEEDIVEFRVPFLKNPIIGKIYWRREMDEVVSGPIYAWFHEWDKKYREDICESINLSRISLSLTCLPFLGWQNWLYPHTIEEKDIESQTKK